MNIVFMTYIYRQKETKRINNVKRGDQGVEGGKRL
jgi:hypothetical protein